MNTPSRYLITAEHLFGETGNLPDVIEVIASETASVRYVREPAPRFTPLHWHIKEARLGVDAVGCRTVDVTLMHIDNQPTVTLPSGRVVIIPEENWQP